MMRQQIQELIKAIQPLDLLEKDHIDFVLKWMASGAQLWRVEKPATPPIHLVSYCVKIDTTHRKILLTDHKKSGLWLPTGGHVEPGEHPQKTAVREIEEELGTVSVLKQNDPLFLTVTQTVGSTSGHTDVSLWYLFQGSIDESFCFDLDEFHRVQWFSFNEIPFEQTDPHMKRFLQKLLIQR